MIPSITVAGLLHDIGKMLLSSQMRDHNVKSGNAGDAPTQLERNALGIDHGEAGAPVLFSPEFRNRHDEIVRVESLPEEAMERVIDKFVRQLQERLRKRKIEIELRPAARKRFAKKGYDPDFGARPLEGLKRNRRAEQRNLDHGLPGATGERR